MSETFFIFAGWLVAVVVSVTASQGMARKRKRDVEGWVLISAFVGPLAPLALYLLGEAPPLTREQRERTARASGMVSTVILFGLAVIMVIPFLRACFKI